MFIGIKPTLKSFNLSNQNERLGHKSEEMIEKTMFIKKRSKQARNLENIFLFITINLLILQNRMKEWGTKQKKKKKNDCWNSTNIVFVLLPFVKERELVVGKLMPIEVAESAPRRSSMVKRQITSKGGKKSQGLGTGRQLEREKEAVCQGNNKQIFKKSI